MKHIFLDTNFIVDLTVRDNYKETAQNLLKIGVKNGCIFYVSFLTVANYAYICRKLPKEVLLKNLSSITTIFKVLPNNLQHIKLSIEEKTNDFEDALQYFTALENHCDCIVTRNENDFKFSKLPIYQ